mgnify:CR=1 FL=1
MSKMRSGFATVHNSQDLRTATVLLEMWLGVGLMAFVLRTLEEFGNRTSQFKIAWKLRYTCYHCSSCGVNIPRDATSCGHCGASLI